QQWEQTTDLKRDDYYATIPSLPISYASARPILERLAGPNVPDGWQGALPFSYHVGPGPVEVSFSVAYDYKVRTIWNVMATLKGSAEPDRWVMLGNHRDAWTYGAVDPSSGTSATLEACRALGEAKKAGWTPRRTILYASWDAEEYGLVGSTEWAEEHEKEIGQKAVLMLNVDSAVSGPNLSADGIPSLRDLFLSAASDVTNPRTGKTLADEWLEARRRAWASEPVDLDATVWSGRESAKPPFPEFQPQMNFLGSGSDYTAFVDHLGVPALNVDFEGRYGVYHSIYDDYFWMEHFGDPEFLLHSTAGKLYALIMMRAASSEVVPLTFTPYAQALREHVDDLRRSIARKERASGKPFEFEGLDDLISAVRRFDEQAHSLDRETANLAHRGDVDAATLQKANDALTRVERQFLLKDGLPGRAWFKHSLYAPGLTTGYASWPLPAVRQAIEENDHKALEAAVQALVPRIEAATESMKTAQDASKLGD
ncbi:MAG TPA: transferrin receptor-like dimerization domain-containing protein, partial [Isosphaeraceae bacterium]|nr:transferrin receptor-like dimerization domain-containing protein [Isosphaeraceae bacterium]